MMNSIRQPAKPAQPLAGDAPEPLRCAALIRMSTDAQQLSPERQRAAFHQYCERYNLIPAGEYADEGVSATKNSLEHRPQLQALLLDARQRLFELVWCEEITRIAREVWEFGFVLEVLRGYGVRLVSYKQDPRQPEHEDEEDLQYIKALFGRRETKRLSRRVRDTLRMRVSQGAYRGGNIALGLTWTWDQPRSDHSPGEGHWGIDEEAAATATTAFETYLLTRSYEATAAALNTGGHRTAQGHKWRGSSVREVLLGPAYRGRQRFGKEEFVVPSLPEIVPAHLVARVDELMANRRSRTKRCDQSQYVLFSGLLRCPDCSTWLTANLTHRNRNRVSVFYYCWRGRHEPHDCPNLKYVPQISLEKAIVPVITAQLAELLAELPAVAPPERGHTLESQRRRLQKMDDERARLLEQHQRGWIDEADMARRMAELQTRRETVQAELTQVTPEGRLHRVKLQQALEDLQGDYWERSIPWRRDLLQSLLEYIIPLRENYAASRLAWKPTSPPSSPGVLTQA